MTDSPGWLADAPAGRARVSARSMGAPAFVAGGFAPTWSASVITRYMTRATCQLVLRRLFSFASRPAASEVLEGDAARALRLRRALEVAGEPPSLARCVDAGVARQGHPLRSRVNRSATGSRDGPSGPSRRGARQRHAPIARDVVRNSSRCAAQTLPIGASIAATFAGDWMPWATIQRSASATRAAPDGRQLLLQVDDNYFCRSAAVLTAHARLPLGVPSGTRDSPEPRCSRTRRSSC